MSRLTRDGTAEPVSRGQIIRRERDKEIMFILPVQLTTSRIGNLIQLILVFLFWLSSHPIYSERQTTAFG